MIFNKYSNFAFLYHINRDLYKRLHEAEQMARINYRDCGKKTRDALEAFADAVIRDKGLTHYFDPNATLADKMYCLSNISKMREAGYLSSWQTFRDKPLLPWMEKIDVLLESSEIENMHYTTFMRKFGNACTHTEIKEDNPTICYDHIIKCLQGHQLLLQRYYKDRLPKKMSAFNEDLMPIDKYVVYDAKVPADKERSKCIMEYLAYEPDDDGTPDRYLLIREYDRNSSDTTFMLRNQTCFKAATKQTRYGVEGMAQLQEITPRNSGNSDRYLICYIFNQEPQPLSNKILREMDMYQRMEMCRGIVKCLNNLHNAKSPIFHRLLSYESIYVCKFEDEWCPYIVKFDYAKIVTTKQIGTVFMSTVESQNYLRKQGREKYLPPEWVQISEGAIHADWAKVDVYSLGVLLCDILSGEISHRQVDLNDLEDMDVPELVLEVLDGMLAESPAYRFSMKEVQEVFDCETR